MRMRRSFVLPLVLAVTLSTCNAARAGLIFSPSEKVALAMEEALVLETSILTQAFGQAPADLSYSGSFSSSGWSSTLTGVYAGLPVTVSYTGLFDAATDQGSYTSEGFVGGQSWSGSGTFGFSGEPGSTDALLSWCCDVNTFDFIFDRKILEPGKRHFREGDTIFDVGFYQRTFFGAPVGPPQREVSIRFVGRVMPFMWESEVDTDEGISLRGTADFSTGTASGVTTVVPESSSLASVALGVLGLLSLARLRRAVEKKRDR